MSGFDFSQEAANCCSDNEIKEVADNFRDYKKKVDNLKKKLVNPHRDDNSNSFFFRNFICSSFQLTEKTNTCVNEDKFKNDINKVDLSELFTIKNKLKLDFDTLNFEQQCHQVNQILNKCNFFLKAYELK